jgi:hypothetical protein
MVLAGRRQWRLFYWFAWLMTAAIPSNSQTPALTTVSDTVFRANGNFAAGTLLISWPAFTTADNHLVAAGSTSVVLGTSGTFTVQLAPNVGATPSGVVYTVVYQLTDGTVKTEYWSVGTTSPEDISQVRTLVGISFGAGQMATQAYVNAALANVVHLTGSETITGAKQFAVSPVLPTPVQSGQAVNKAYVDASVANTGAGNFVMKSGDVMTGALTLSADPNAPNQASTKHYVDVSSALKADLIAGTVPASELGSGTANSSACLHGDATWSGCGSGNGTGLTPGMQAIKYATDFAWSQSNGANLSTAGAKTVTLASCPAGVSGTEPQYYVYISGTGTAEAVLVTGGTCAGNNQSGTLQFTTANPHAAGYAIGSASSGLQEALIAARFTPSNPTGSSQSGRVIVPPGEIKAFARVSIRASNVTVDFSGSIVECWMNDTCIFVGDPTASTLFDDVTLLNPRGRPTVAGGQKPFIEVHYRGHGRAMARVTNASSIAAEQNGSNDGVRAAVRRLKMPPAQTSVDCENAALVIVTDGTAAGYRGKYQTWSDFLPDAAADIFPGDALGVNVPSRTASFLAIVKEVAIAVKDLAGEHCVYELQFEHAVSEDLAFEFDSQITALFESNSQVTTAFLGLSEIPDTQVGNTTLPSLTGAAITDVSSTTATMDAGLTPQTGGGIEVRWSDFGWGQNNDQNLAGRFTTQTFTLPRLGRVEDYFLRQYDGSTPPKYSRYTAALHIDYPL